MSKKCNLRSVAFVVTDEARQILLVCKKEGAGVISGGTEPRERGQIFANVLCK